MPLSELFIENWLLVAIYVIGSQITFGVWYIRKKDFDIFTFIMLMFFSPFWPMFLIVLLFLR